MSKNSLRNRLKRLFYRALVWRSKAESADFNTRSAVIFSPHQDDETLGCGGTIIRKTAAGAAVWVVFMTDGHQSHQHLMAPEQLTAIRKREALAACAMLGVPESNVIFLNFPDGSLSGSLDTAAQRVREILNNVDASDLFIPYSGEPTDDHKATHAVLQKALAAQPRSYAIYEFPVWFWHHWPWVSLFQRNAHDTLFVVKNTFKALFGLTLFRFRRRVCVKDVYDQKLASLNQHKSQMTQLNNNPHWLTLHHVSKGEFLTNSLQPYELFHHYVYKPVKGSL